MKTLQQLQEKTRSPLQKKGQQIADSIKANQQVQKAKEALKPINIAKGAAIGTLKDITYGGGAAGDLVKKGIRKIGTSTGYMVGRAAKGVASKIMDFLETSNYYQKDSKGNRIYKK
jgi:hypothetical protein